MTPSPFAAFEQHVFDRMRQGNLPGISAAVVQGEDVIWSRGFGFRHVEKGLPATPHTLYPIASITKSFTCAAIMQLAEQGKLSVDDPIRDYVPLDIQPGGEPVRIWHLMTHTSGIPALAYAEAVLAEAAGITPSWLPLASYDDMLTFLRDAGDWATGKPGERFFYLNEGYILLGLIVERASGLPYRDYIRQHILEPLGMARSVFAKDAIDADPEVAALYTQDDKGARRPTPTFFGLLGADGGLFSTALDMARTISMYLGEGAACGAAILPPARIAEMQTPRITTPTRGGAFGDYQYGYGLGVMDNFLGHRLIGHSGGLVGATSYMGFVPDAGLGIIILCNGEAETPPLGRYGLAVALGENPDELFPALVLETKLKALEGTYETYKGTTKVLVRRKDTLLAVEFKGNLGSFTTLLLPEHIGETEHAFYTMDGNGYKTLHEFRVRDGQVDFYSERYLYRRTGPLP